MKSNLLALLLLSAGSSVAGGQRISQLGEDGRTLIPPPGASENPPSFVRPIAWRTGVHGGTGVEGTTFTIVSQTLFEERGAPWLRLHFSPHDLGAASFVRVQSLYDGTIQDLDAFALANWYDYSAFFTGDALLVELHVAPLDEGVFLEVDFMRAGNPLYVGPAHDDPGGGDPGQESLCGADDRVASGETRVGRIRRPDGVTFCSPWLASNGAVLMAGHCFDNDNNGSNELVGPGSVVEFNPPASSSSGAPNPSLAKDQYPIDMTTLNWSPSPYAIGSDWGVFGLNPNATLADSAHLTRGFYRMTRELPSTFPTPSNIRITGCGDDSTPAGSTGGKNSKSQTVQTDVGYYSGEADDGFKYWHHYATDTTNNSSGSPILWEAAGVTIGIHTNAGCSQTGGANQGCSFEHTPLETALRDFVATNAIFVDAGMPSLGAAQDGTVFRPFTTVQFAVVAAPSDSVFSIVAGTYHPASGGAYTISTAVTLTAPVGSVVLTD